MKSDTPTRDRLARAIGDVVRPGDKPIRTHPPDRSCNRCSRMLSVHNPEPTCNACTPPRRPW